MYSIPLFYIFFCVLAISSIWIIVMRWKRYMKYSNGTYKNAGQNLIFKTELSQNEIIRKLETHDAKDTLDYDFYEKNVANRLVFNAIKRLNNTRQKVDVVTVYNELENMKIYYNFFINKL